VSILILFILRSNIILSIKSSGFERTNVQLCIIRQCSETCEFTTQGFNIDRDGTQKNSI